MADWFVFILIKPVSRHFNYSNHSISNFVAVGYLSSRAAMVVAKLTKCFGYS